MSTTLESNMNKIFDGQQRLSDVAAATYNTLADLNKNIFKVNS